ncbi:MAG: beta-propeller domain-containing protein [Candidatus Bathyarchaeota archaeon]|nr:beta-propeller domain-containing protein [Candidatus Bathyarchaeota archaeon]
MVQREITKKTRIYGTAAVLCAIVLVSTVYVFGAVPVVFPSQAPSASGLKTFSSMQEIADYLTANSQGTGYYGGGPLDSKFFGTGTRQIPAPMPQSSDANTLTAGESSSNAMDYSTTNIQVAGVDEADTVKTDGQYIYTLSSFQPTYRLFSYDASSGSDASNMVYILNADPQNPSVVSKIVLGNDTQPAGLFLSEDGKKLVVIASKYNYITDYSRWENPSAEPMIMPAHQSDVYTYINVYDVADKANPVLTRNFTMTGSYFNSRMIGDKVYTVVSQTAWIYNNVVPLPAVYDGDIKNEASPTCIYYADMNDTSYSFTSYYGISLADDNLAPTNMTVMMGGASTMYVSSDNIYITYPNWDQNAGSYTAIYRVAIDGLNLSLQAQGSVPGNTLNQYSMDEYNGYFRIATNWYGTETQTNNVYVLNSDMQVTGKLEGLAENENLHAVRFMGDKGYLVTFKQTDPLFVVDLSNPTDPKVLGELKIPGYSDYLHPYDASHLIGVGKEAVADADREDFAWYQGVKLALFDVSDVNTPSQLSNYVIGERGTDSQVLYEPKAFLFDQAKGLLVIPVSLALVSEENKQYGDSAYGDTVWQGAYVFSVSLDGGFTLKGTITHLNPSMLDSQGHLKNINDYYSTQNEWVTRSLYIDNVLYTFSNSQVKLNSLTDLSEIAAVTLN